MHRIKGPFSCAGCRKVHYCSKLHQKMHWKQGHKQQCTSSQVESDSADYTGILFPEHAIEVEREELDNEMHIANPIADKATMWDDAGMNMLESITSIVIFITLITFTLITIITLITHFYFCYYYHFQP